MIEKSSIKTPKYRILYLRIYYTYFLFTLSVKHPSVGLGVSQTFSQSGTILYCFSQVDDILDSNLKYSVLINYLHIFQLIRFWEKYKKVFCLISPLYLRVFINFKGWKVSHIIYIHKCMAIICAKFLKYKAWPNVFFKWWNQGKKIIKNVFIYYFHFFKYFYIGIVEL